MANVYAINCLENGQTVVFLHVRKNVVQMVYVVMENVNAIRDQEYGQNVHFLVQLNVVMTAGVKEVHVFAKNQEFIPTVRKYAQKIVDPMQYASRDNVFAISYQEYGPIVNIILVNRLILV